MDGIEPEEKIEETIEDIFKREKNNVDGKIEDIFIDDNEAFENDDITEDDKYFIRSLINKTNFFPQNNEKDGDNNIDFTIEEVDVDPPLNKDLDEVIYVKTVPAPSVEKPLHPRERLRKKVKEIRKRKENYRTKTKKKAISFLNKKNAKKLLKDHILNR